MHFDIKRENGRLQILNMSCDCAYSHEIPDMQIYIKAGLINECARCLSENGLGKNIVIVADNNTLKAAGKTLKQQLISNCFNCRMCLLPGEEIEPLEETVQLIVSMVDSGTDLLLSVGSGVITDLTRRAAFITDLPFAVFGTAASMDGYTSITSAMIIDGMKVTKYGKAAKLLMFDTQVLSIAPLLMQASGVGDLLAKYNVLVDWKLGSAAAGETFCPLCEKMLKIALDKCSSNIKEIQKRTIKGTEALIEALILAGLTVLIVGDTRSVASVEHNMAHYWEMMKIAYGGLCPSHGISVGIGFIYTLLFHDMLRQADLSKIDKDKIKAARLTKQQKKELLISCYPPGVGKEVMQTNDNWHIEWPEQEKRIDALIKYHDKYKKNCEILPDYKKIIEYLKGFGAPTSASKAKIDKTRLLNALLYTRMYRKRYCITEALSNLGMLEQCAQSVMDKEQTL